MKKSAFIVLTAILAVSIINAQENSLVYDLGNSREPVTSVNFTPDSRYLVAGGFLTIYDMENGSEYHSPALSDKYLLNRILNARISNDGRYLVAVKQNGVELFDLRSRLTITKVRAMRVAAADVDPLHDRLVYARSNGELVFWDIQSQKKLTSHNLDRLKPTRLAWSKSGKYLAIGGGGDMIILFDAEKKTIAYNARLKGRAVRAIEFTDDGSYVGVALKSGDVHLLDIEKRELILSLKAHDGEAHALAFHPSGMHMATGGADKRVKIWEIPSGKPVASWPAHEKAVLALDFSPDGTMLASGCFNGPLMGINDTRVWDAAKMGIPLQSAGAKSHDSTEGIQGEVHEQAVPVSNHLEAVAEAEQKRLALVIGNGNYMYGGILANPENDANDIGERLQQLGFDVMLHNNLDQKTFRKAIDDFGYSLEEYDVALFYYAGHGIQVKGNNYLIPVDANLKSENDVEYDCVNAGRLLAKMEDAGSTTNIVILDACRDNPFERSWRRSTHGMGLAFMTAPAGSLISYATSPGATASDGTGRNGLFTSALLTHINEPGLSILEMFQKVRTYVREHSGGVQVPWESTSLEGNFYFK
ncbi:MAG: caspase family protein [Bacteroidales bacterium]|nr:caspase family protein [Bacteroidales bacterium]